MGRYTPHGDAKPVREPIGRPGDFGQAGQAYGNFEPWERGELVNLGHNPAPCGQRIRDAIIDHPTRADADHGRRTTETTHRHAGQVDGDNHAGQVTPFADRHHAAATRSGGGRFSWRHDSNASPVVYSWRVGDPGAGGADRE